MKIQTFYEVPKGATHFALSTDKERDHFIKSDEVGNVYSVFCPDYSFLGWDNEIEIYPIPISAIPIDSYISMKSLTEENKRMREALVKSQSDIKSIIDHLFSLGLDDAWAVCKLNDMLDDVNYVLKGE